MSGYSVIIYKNKIGFINDSFVAVSIEEIMNNVKYGYLVDNKIMDKISFENELLKIIINHRCNFNIQTINKCKETRIIKIDSLSKLLKIISFIKE